MNNTSSIFQVIHHDEHQGNKVESGDMVSSMPISLGDTLVHTDTSGGGIGGLTLAVALSKAKDVQVDVYEATSKFSEVGAGVGMWKRTWNVMEELGLGDDLKEMIGRELSNDLGKCCLLTVVGVHICSPTSVTNSTSVQVEKVG